MEDNLTVSDVAKKWGVIYGLIGLIMLIFSAMFDVSTLGMTWQVLVFVITVGIAFTIYFLASKEYKESNSGLITFGQSFGIAILAGLIGGLIRAIGFYLYVKVIDTNYMDRVLEAQEQVRERMGAPEIDPDQLPAFMKFFQTPEFLGISTLINAMLGALIIGLIVAAIVQKKEDYTY